MNRKLKSLIIGHHKEQGFVFVIALSMGLIMALVGLATLLQSEDENTLATAQQSTSNALNAADTGVTRFRNMIGANKVLAMYPATGSNSWTNPAGITGITDACSYNTATAIQNAVNNRDWQNINSSDPSQGQYRLVDYTYTDNYDSGSSSYNSLPFGTLTVEGRVASSGNYSQGNMGIGATRVQVILPIQPGIVRVPSNATISLRPNLNFLDPALWIGSTSTTQVTNLTVNGNILFSNSTCNLPSGTGDPTDANLGDPNAQSITVKPISLPTPPVLPATYNTITNSSDLYQPTGEPIPLPSGTHTADGNNYYHYLVEDNLTLTAEGLNIVDGTKVILYVQGNINIQGNVNNGTNNSAYLEIYGNTGSSSPYNYGCATGVSCPTQQVTFTGNTNFTGFIHAPGATVTTTGTPTVDITGAIWVNNWNTATGNVTISPDDQYFNYSTVQNMINANSRLVEAIIEKPSSWEILEVQQQSMNKNQQNQCTQQGFTMIEVLVSAFILTTLAMMSIQLVALSTYSRVKAQIKTQTDTWISEDIANSKYEASNIARDDSKCLASAYDDGYAKQLQDSIDSNYPVSPREIFGVDYNLQRTYETANSTAPHKVLIITNRIRKWEGGNYTGNPVAEARIEIIPDVALECP